MPKRKKATASDELVMVKSVCRTRSRRMKFCVQRGLGVSLNKQRQGAVAILGHCLPICENTIIQFYIVKKVFVQSVKKWHFGEDKVFPFYYT